MARINIMEAGIDLAINLFEQNLEDIDRFGWGNRAGMMLFRSQVRDQVNDFIANNQSLLPFFETGFRTLLFAALPNLSPETRHAVSSLLDIYTDGLRGAIRERDEHRQEAKYADASGEFRKAFSRVMDEAKKKAAIKPPLATLVMRLTPDERNAYMRVMNSLNEHEQRHWTEFKERILTVDELRLFLSQRNNEARFNFLRATYGRTPTVLETLAAAARGEDSPATRALQGRVDRTRAEMQRLRREIGADLRQMNERHGRR